VAYRQPITKPEVDQIRGVDSGYILRQLLEKMLIRVSGRADSPGKPLLYKTTKYFLKHFDINSVDELPKPREIDEILKDDDMADHRRLLMERQMELEDEDAEELFDHYVEKREDEEGGNSENKEDAQADADESPDGDIDEMDEKREEIDTERTVNENDDSDSSDEQNKNENGEDRKE